MRDGGKATGGYMNPHTEQNLIELADALANNEPAPQPIASMLADAITSRIEYGGTLDAWMGIDGGNRYVFQEKAGGWIVGDGYEQTFIRTKLKGYLHLRFLLQRPHKTAHVLEVDRLGATGELWEETEWDDSVTEGRMRREDMIDRDAVVSVGKRMVEIERQLESPELLSEFEREALEKEHEQCEGYIRSSKGRHGMRFFNDEAEKARKRVQKSIKAALTEIGQCHPAVGEHLRLFVKTGSELTYSPDRTVTWDC